MTCISLFIVCLAKSIEVTKDRGRRREKVLKKNQGEKLPTIKRCVYKQNHAHKPLLLSQ